MSKHIQFVHKGINSFPPMMVQGGLLKPSNQIVCQNQELEHQSFPDQYHQKLSAEMEEEQNSKEFFTQNTISELYIAQARQNEFMENLSDLRDQIMQDEVISYVSDQGEKYEKLNYSMIKEYTSSRIQKMLKNKKVKKNWSNEDLKVLVWIVGKYCEKKRIKDLHNGIEETDWNYISTLIPGTSPEMCMFKWLSLKKSKVRDQKWQKKEQLLLQELVKQHGQKKWGEISKQLFYQNEDLNKVFRCAKQCREHWNCFVNPNIKKGNWTEEQDNLLLCLVYEAGGKKKWAKLVKKFGGRTQNALKNRYSIILQRQALTGKKQTEPQILQRLINQIRMERSKKAEKKEVSIMNGENFSAFRLTREENKLFEPQNQRIEDENEEMHQPLKKCLSLESFNFINPSMVVSLNDDTFKELTSKKSSLFYALKKDSTFHLTSGHEKFAPNRLM